MNVEAAQAAIQMSPVAKADLSRLRRAAGQTVGSFFYGTLLRTMRESSLKGDYGHGGRGEDVFAGQLHNLMAESLGTSPNNDLGEIVYRSLERQQQLISQQRAPVETGVESAKE